MRCTKCGAEAEPNALFCSLCGTRLPRPQEEPAPRPAPLANDGLQGEWSAPPPVRLADLRRPLSGTGDAVLNDAYRGAAAIDMGDGVFKSPGFSVFSPSGRMNRAKFFYMYALYLLGSFLCGVGVAFAGTGTAAADLSLQVARYAVFALLLAVWVISIIKRFHDLNLPGYHYFLLLIPFYNFYIAIKLFFSKSYEEQSEFGLMERNSFYWQAPLILVLVPVLFLAASLAFGHSNLMAAIAGKTDHFYSKQYSVSMDFPAGWNRLELENTIVATQNYNGSEAISLDAGDTAEASMSGYSDLDLSQIADRYSDKDAFCEQFGFDSASVSGLTCAIHKLGQAPFLMADFTRANNGLKYHHLYLAGIEDGHAYVIRAAVPVGDEAAYQRALAAIDSLRVGAEAQEQSGQ